MFTSSLPANYQIIIRRTALYTYGLVSAWAFNISSPVFGVLVASPIVMMLHFDYKSAMNWYLKQAACLALGLLLAEYYSASPFALYVISLLLAALIILKVKTTQSMIVVPTLFFFFMLAIVFTTFDISMEADFYSLFGCILLQFPFACLIFKLFPGESELSVNNIYSVTFPLKNKLFAISILSLTLLLFLLFNLTTSIFCALVACSCAFSVNSTGFQKSVAAIIPIQVGGCLVGLVINTVIFILPGNLIWASFVLCFFSVLYIYHAILNPHPSYPNYENNILRASLIPVSLYSHTNFLSISDYMHRSFDMLITAIALLFISYLVNKMHLLPQTDPI